MSFENIRDQDFSIPELPEGESDLVPGQFRYQADRQLVVLTVDVPTTIQTILKEQFNNSDNLKIDIEKSVPSSEEIAGRASSIIITAGKGRKGEKFISEKISYRVLPVSIHVLINEENAYDKCAKLSMQVESTMFAKDWNGTAIKWVTLSNWGFQGPPTSTRAYYILTYDCHYFIQFENLDRIPPE